MVTFEGLQGRGNQALDRQGLFHLIFIGLFTGARRESAVGDCWPVQGADVSPGEISEFVGQLEGVAECRFGAGTDTPIGPKPLIFKR